MNSISVNVVFLLLRGIPECILAVLALHFFTRTKINPRKFILLCLIYTLGTYLIRFLPIALAVHSILSLMIMIIVFQLFYKTNLSEVISTVISAAVILVLLATAEVANMLLLIVIYGRVEAEALFTAKDGLTQSIYTFPSIIIFAVFIFAGYFILKKYDAGRPKNGEIGETSGR